MSGRLDIGGLRGDNLFMPRIWALLLLLGSASCVRTTVSDDDGGARDLSSDGEASVDSRVDALLDAPVDALALASDANSGTDGADQGLSVVDASADLTPDAFAYGPGCPRPAPGQVVLFVRADGSGDDDDLGTSWDRALATLQAALDRVDLSETGPSAYLIKLAANDAATPYRPAALGGTVKRPLSVTIQGDFRDLRCTAGTPQNGKSIIAGGGLASGDVGLAITTKHNNVVLQLEQLDIQRVQTGVELRPLTSSITSLPDFTLRSCTIAAGGVGLLLDDQSIVGPAKLELAGTTVQGGMIDTESTSHGIHLVVLGLHLRIRGHSAIRSYFGDGVRIEETARRGTESSVSISRSDLSDSAGDGLRWQTPPGERFDERRELVLDRVLFVSNGGFGVRLQLPLKRLEVDASNVLVADSGFSGVWLSSKRNTVDWTASTFAKNGGDGLHVEQSSSEAAELSVNNCAFIEHAGSGLWASAGADNFSRFREGLNAYWANGTDVQRGGLQQPLDSEDLTSDPLLFGHGPPSYQAYQPVPGSPLLDGGDPLYSPIVDLLDMPRPQGDGPAIGAFETSF